jgi:hypothetical protein
MSNDVVDWALNMFRINNFSATNLGEIANWMLVYHPELNDEIIELSCKLNNCDPITNTDWDLIVSGIEKYRPYLLGTEW